MVMSLKNKIGVAVVVVILLGAVLIVVKSPTLSTTDTKTSTTKTYSMTEVAKHKSPSDCWTTVNGNVYNLTAFISKHPGGDKAILFLCGKDGTTFFNGQHGGQARPASELAGFEIGKLSQ